MKAYLVYMNPKVTDLGEQIAPILREHSVLRAGVFGSRARGEERPDSDLDLLVELENGSSLLDLIGLELEISERLGVKAQVITYRSLHPLLRDRILADEVPILIRRIPGSFSSSSSNVLNSSLAMSMS